MDLKINVELDLSEFTERWTEDNLASCIEEAIKQEALREVTRSREYKALVERTRARMMKKILEDA